MLERIVCLIIGYAFGLIQTGFIYGKMHGIDIREHGSGNSGATNTLRTLGTKAGFIVLFGDAIKCILAIVLTYFLFGRNNPEYLFLYRMYTAFGVILGHDFPFYLQFKGGKGIAATAGVIVCYGPVYFLIHILVFAVIFLTTHYVSLGSILIYITFFVMILVCGQSGYFDARAGVDIPQSALIEMYVLVFIMTVIAIWRHRANIKRLLGHNESKVYLSKRGKEKSGKKDHDDLV